MRAAVNGTYPRDRPHYPTVRGSAWAAWAAWASWFVGCLSFGRQIGISDLCQLLFGTGDDLCYN